MEALSRINQLQKLMHLGKGAGPQKKVTDRSQELNLTLKVIPKPSNGVGKNSITMQVNKGEEWFFKQWQTQKTIIWASDDRNIL